MFCAGVAAHILNLRAAVYFSQLDRRCGVLRNRSGKVKHVGIGTACIIECSPACGDNGAAAKTAVGAVYNLIKNKGKCHDVALKIFSARHRRNAY